eukprot:g1268.t1
MENARRETDVMRKRETEDRALREAEERARNEAEEEARQDTEKETQRKAEEEVRHEAEDQVRHEAEDQTRREAEDQARREVDDTTQRETEDAEHRKNEEQPQPEASAVKQQLDTMLRQAAIDRLRVFYDEFDKKMTENDIANDLLEFPIPQDLNQHLATKYGIDLQCVRMATFEDKLRQFYLKHNPAKLDGNFVDVVEYYEGDEASLNAELASTYDGADLSTVPEYICDRPTDSGSAVFNAAARAASVLAIQKRWRGIYTRQNVALKLAEQQHKQREEHYSQQHVEEDESKAHAQLDASRPQAAMPGPRTLAVRLATKGLPVLPDIKGLLEKQTVQTDVSGNLEFTFGEQVWVVAKRLPDVGGIDSFFLCEYRPNETGAKINLSEARSCMLIPGLDGTEFEVVDKHLKSHIYRASTAKEAREWATGLHYRWQLTHEFKSARIALILQVQSWLRGAHVRREQRKLKAEAAEELKREASLSPETKQERANSSNTLGEVESEVSRIRAIVIEDVPTEFSSLMVRMCALHWLDLTHRRTRGTNAMNDGKADQMTLFALDLGTAQTKAALQGEYLMKQLMALDQVQPHGSKQIRKRRKEMVLGVQSLLDAVDRNVRRGRVLKHIYDTLVPDLVERRRVAQQKKEAAERAQRLAEQDRRDKEQREKALAQRAQAEANEQQRRAAQWQEKKRQRRERKQNKRVSQKRRERTEKALSGSVSQFHVVVEHVGLGFGMRLREVVSESEQWSGSGSPKNEAPVKVARVIGLTEGKPAKLCGEINVGDVLVSVNGKNVIGMEFSRIMSVLKLARPPRTKMVFQRTIPPRRYEHEFRSSGWLIKQGAGTSTFGRKSWKRRWFVLDFHNLEVRYYTDQSMREQKGVFSLRDSVHRHPHAEPEVGVHADPTHFELHTQAVHNNSIDRVYKLVADPPDVNVVQEWLKSFRHVSRMQQGLEFEPITDAFFDSDDDHAATDDSADDDSWSDDSSIDGHSLAGSSRSATGSPSNPSVGVNSENVVENMNKIALHAANQAIEGGAPLDHALSAAATAVIPVMLTGKSTPKYASQAVSRAAKAVQAAPDDVAQASRSAAAMACVGLGLGLDDAATVMANVLTEVLADQEFEVELDGMTKAPQWRWGGEDCGAIAETFDGAKHDGVPIVGARLVGIDGKRVTLLPDAHTRKLLGSICPTPLKKVTLQLLPAVRKYGVLDEIIDVEGKEYSRPRDVELGEGELRLFSDDESRALLLRVPLTTAELTCSEASNRGTPANLTLTLDRGDTLEELRLSTTDRQNLVEWCGALRYATSMAKGGAEFVVGREKDQSVMDSSRYAKITDTRFCPQCGMKQTSLDGRFCDFCGYDMLPLTSATKQSGSDSDEDLNWLGPSSSPKRRAAQRIVAKQMVKFSDRIVNNAIAQGRSLRHVRQFEEANKQIRSEATSLGLTELKHPRPQLAPAADSPRARAAATLASAPSVVLSTSTALTPKATRVAQQVQKFNRRVNESSRSRAMYNFARQVKSRTWVGMRARLQILVDDLMQGKSIAQWERDLINLRSLQTDLKHLNQKNHDLRRALMLVAAGADAELSAEVRASHAGLVEQYGALMSVLHCSPEVLVKLGELLVPQARDQFAIMLTHSLFARHSADNMHLLRLVEFAVLHHEQAMGQSARYGSAHGVGSRRLSTLVYDEHYRVWASSPLHSVAHPRRGVAGQTCYSASPTIATDTSFLAALLRALSQRPDFQLFVTQALRAWAMSCACAQTKCDGMQTSPAGLVLSGGIWVSRKVASTHPGMRVKLRNGKMGQSKHDKDDPAVRVDGPRGGYDAAAVELMDHFLSPRHDMPQIPSALATVCRYLDDSHRRSKGLQCFSAADFFFGLLLEPVMREPFELRDLYGMGEAASTALFEKSEVDEALWRSVSGMVLQTAFDDNWHKLNLSKQAALSPLRKRVCAFLRILASNSSVATCADEFGAEMPPESKPQAMQELALFADTDLKMVHFALRQHASALFSALGWLPERLLQVLKALSEEDWAYTDAAKHAMPPVLALRIVQQEADQPSVGTKCEELHHEIWLCLKVSVHPWR